MADVYTNTDGDNFPGGECGLYEQDGEEVLDLPQLKAFPLAIVRLRASKVTNPSA
jgi:hypothetical protein